jgi:hypothetical protein
MGLGDTTVIADVTEMLSSLLTDLVVTQDSPAELKDSDNAHAKINLYLYQVLENPYSKNQTYVTSPSSHDQQSYPPLAVNLYYLLTPYASDAKSAHSVLGHAMRLFHDNSIIEKVQLPAPLRLILEQLSISLCPMKLEELTRIWNSLQRPYRLSIAYEVKILLIRSETQRTIRRVEEKQTFYSQKENVTASPKDEVTHV